VSARGGGKRRLPRRGEAVLNDRAEDLAQDHSQRQPIIALEQPTISATTSADFDFAKKRGGA
jgi:hypothetical protein